MTAAAIAAAVAASEAKLENDIAGVPTAHRNQRRKQQ